MSGTNFDSPCPNCGKECDTYNDRKPFEHSTMTCMNCGFQTIIEVTYMGLEELNFSRAEQDKEPLTELPKQEFTW